MLARTSILGLATLLAVVAVVPVEAATSKKSKPTYSIEVSDMHCADCAQQIANQLYKLSGVAKVHASLKSNTAYVTPTAGKKISARKMWEAIEKAKFTPVKLVSPTKTYTKKPKK
jgi:copper chaperone CopZ